MIRKTGLWMACSLLMACTSNNANQQLANEILQDARIQ